MKNFILKKSKSILALLVFVLISNFIVAQNNNIYTTNPNLKNLESIDFNKVNNINLNKINNIDKINNINRFNNIDRIDNIDENYNAKDNISLALKSIISSDSVEFYYFSYNKNNLLLSIESTSFDHKIIDTVFYDDNNNITKIDYYQFINNDWAYVSYILYTYDEQGNRITRENYNSYNTDEFHLGGIYTYEYNDKNQLVYWELEMPSLGIVQRANFTYNANDLLEEEIGEDCFSGPWNYAYKIGYSYDLNNNLISEIGYDYSGSWIPYLTIKYNYDDNNNCIKETKYNSSNAITDQVIYHYDNSINATNIAYPYIPETNDYCPISFNNKVDYREWHSQDENFNLVHVCDYNYNYEEVEIIEDDTICNPIENLNINLDQTIATLTWDKPNDDKDYKYKVYSNNTLIADELEETTFTDENATSEVIEYCIIAYTNYCESEVVCLTVTSDNIEDLPNTNIAIYPNPAKSEINIDNVCINKIYMYNSIGKLIKTTTNNKVNVSNFSKGLYTLKIISKDGNVYTEKVVID